jgi:hypothetical protein
MVGFDQEVETGKGKIISILFEKNFMCMDGREEDNAVSYPIHLPISNSKLCDYEFF